MNASMVVGPPSQYSLATGRPSFPIVLDRNRKKTQVLHIDRPKISSELSVRCLTVTFQLKFFYTSRVDPACSNSSAGATKSGT